MANDFEKEYAKLNLAQKKAVDAIDGPVVVIAGPGTGKTQLLSLRAANILKLTDTSAQNILCLTFTEAAADNIRQRLAKFIGQEANRVEIYTFHGFGSHIIQNYPEYFNDGPLLNHLNELGQFELLQNLMNRLHHDNPLSKKVGDSFLHLPTIISTISWLKQAGLLPDDLRIETLKNRSFFKSANKYLSKAFKDSPASKNVNLYGELLENLNSLNRVQPSSLAKTSTQELELAILQIDIKSRYAKSITEWRKKWLIQSRLGHWQYIDQQRNNFLIEVANLYEDYENYLKKSGLYTYDDMILRTLKAIESNQELKLLLQEQYQYILVDEYQDTNGAQNKLLTLIGNNEINENKPNIMVVGDDDQAIYRFQGAESSIIFDFINRWTSPEIIILKESYRSGQELLDLSRAVIVNAQDRLESQNKDFTKKLQSSGSIRSTKIFSLIAPSETENYIYVSETISKLIKSGTDPSSIAIIAPKHRYLKAVESYLLSLEIPINYEQREHILDQPRIVEIVDLISLIWAASHVKTATIEFLLPKVLAAPYFQLNTDNWWELAILAQKDRQGWLEAMSSYGSQLLRDFSEAIKKLAMECKTQQFELTLSYLLGNKSIQLESGKSFSMPWREYYFGEENIAKEPYSYVRFIGQFNTLIDYFREWNASLKQLLTLDDFHSFIELYKSSNLSLLDQSPYTTSKEAVTLTTAYKAKGLEWDCVFVLNCHDDVWGSKTRNRNLTFKLPSHLKWIEPIRLSSNDLVRLFYVSITRARKNLYLSSFDKKDNGTQTSPLEWLANMPMTSITPIKSPPVEPIKIINNFDSQWQDLYTSPTENLGIILSPILERYKLSATHVNDFLAVNRGGPKYFLFKSLLKIPDLHNPNTIFGQAVHRTLEFTHRQLTDKKKLPKIDDITNFFVEILKSYPLSSSEYGFLKKRGIDNLTKWLSVNGPLFQINDMSEHNFASENIALGNARLTGEVDVLRQIDKSNLLVIDYKTSRPLYSWKGNTGSSAIRSYSYQNQLMFYKLLVDNSSFGNRFKTSLGQINFITPGDDEQVISLDYEYDSDALDRFSKLIDVIWNKITNLDLPEVSKYSSTISGVKDFEEDLLNHNI